YLLSNLPFRDSGRLVAVFEKRPRESVDRNFVSYADFFDWQQQAQAFSGMAGYEPATFNYTDGGEAERVQGAAVTVDLLDVLGVSVWRGRGFAAPDAVPGADGVLVSYGFWQRRLGSDPNIIGRAI